MEATTFNEKSIDHINAILQFVLQNPYSQFYKNLYAGQEIHTIATYNDFKKIPILTKDDFINIPPSERTFIPEDAVARYSFSSGTTNRKRPTVIPHAAWHGEPLYFKEDDLLKCGIKNVLVLRSPLSPGFLHDLTMPKKQIRTIPADIHNMHLSAMIAKEIGVDAITTSPTILDSFVEHARHIDFDFSRIKWLSLGSEFCSQQRRDFFMTFFPNAKITFRYAASEIEGGGYRCEHLSDKAAPDIFHPVKNALFEIVDEHNTTVPIGESGEIVFTHLTEKAFPFIRYKIRDIATLSHSSCPCGNPFELRVGGKTGVDVLRFYGIQLHGEMIEYAVSQCLEYIAHYQMHVFEEKIESRLKPRLELHITLKEKWRKNTEDPYLIEILQKQIQNKLQLSAKASLADLVEQQIFLPLAIKVVKEIPQETYKTKRIISHL